MLLATLVNLLSAFLALTGFVWYVVVYTMWLKRRTPQNIVIGGAAGAVPPLVGWAAVTGGLAPVALYLFAIVFFWTPPHFWALSLLMKDEYAAVHVPMMPVVHGEAETRRQVLLYSVLLMILTLLPVAFSYFGIVYAICAAALWRGVHRPRLRPLPAGRPRRRPAHLPLLARVPRAAVRGDGARRAGVGRFASAVARVAPRALAPANVNTGIEGVGPGRSGERLARFRSHRTEKRPA